MSSSCGEKQRSRTSPKGRVESRDLGPCAPPARQTPRLEGDKSEWVSERQRPGRHLPGCAQSAVGWTSSKEQTRGEPIQVPQGVQSETGPWLTPAGLGSVAEEGESSRGAEQCPRRPPLGRRSNRKEEGREGRAEEEKCTGKGPRWRGLGALASGPGPTPDWLCDLGPVPSLSGPLFPPV